MNTRWFSKFELGTQPALSTMRVIDGLIELLDQLIPSKVDPERSEVTLEPDGATHALLVHRTDLRANIEVIVSADSADVWSLYGLEEHYPLRRQPWQWERDIIDNVAELLTGRFEVEEVTWKDRWVKTVVTDTGSGHQLIARSATAWWTELLLGRHLLHEHRIVDYGCCLSSDHPTSQP